MAHKDDTSQSIPFKPIFVIGAARSGTTLLADRILSRFSGVLYTGEIDFVWRYGQPFIRHDVRRSGKETHKTYIRDWFWKFHASRGAASIVIDKTPSNILRMQWIRSVFPTARFIHVIRDGRAVALSARQEWEGLSSTALDSKKYRQMNRTRKIRDLTARKLRLGDRVKDFRSALVALSDSRKALSAYSKIFGAPISHRTWGPRVPGLSDIAQHMSVLEACAFQWDFCVRMGRLDASSEDTMEIRFEELLEDPQAQVERLQSFINSSIPTESLQEIISSIDTRRLKLEDSSSPDLDQLTKLLSPTLSELGY